MTQRPQKVWITRAQPGADATAARVASLGHVPLVAPLLRVEALRDVAVDLDGVGALAFTSANGVRAFADLSPVRDLAVYAVGQATAKAARDVGFRRVLSTDGDVAALAQGIAARRTEIRGAVLHPSAEEPAGDLAGALAEWNVPVRRLVVYATRPSPVDEAIAAAVAQADVALVHSPRGAQALAEVLAQHPSPSLRVAGLSRAVLEPLAETPLGAKVFAPLPLEAALLNLIEREP